MTATLAPLTVEDTTERRSRVLWGKKAIPLKNSHLFNKAKHSEEWHHSIDATAGVLRPSDPKFPYGFLRNHTDTYLKKKGKINQADTDIRLSILITAHTERDIAVAATAHAITAQSLRALLRADLNVMQGSYWGLKNWLQCLIAANEGNPASVTDMEASWARKLLPFATHPARAAEWYLAGVCLALREMAATPSMNMVPEFFVLVRRAVEDFGRQLDGFRLHNQWNQAHGAISWMKELAKTTPATAPPGRLLPEHILDSQLPIWRVWTHWEPDMDRLKRLLSCSSKRLAVLSDLVALEGPDMITGVETTLREGLIAQYNGGKVLLKWRGIIFEVPERTKTQLKTIMMKMKRLLDIVVNESEPGHESRFELFRGLIIARPITAGALDLIEAVCKIPWTAKNDIYAAILEIKGGEYALGGQHVSSLQSFLYALNDESSADLKNILLTYQLRTGIENCLEDCREAVRTHIEKSLVWTRLAIEYHEFCKVLEASEHHWPSNRQTIKVHPDWPSPEELRMIVQIHEAARNQRQKQPPSKGHSEPVTSEQKTTSEDGAKKSKQASESVSMLTVGRSILEEVTESYCIDRLLAGPTMSYSHQRIVQNIMLVWKQTSKPTIDEERRELAILVSENAGSDFTLRCRYLAEIAYGKELLEPGTSAKELLIIVRKSKVALSQAIIDLTNLLSSRKAWTSCWKDLLYLWLEQQDDSTTYLGQNVLEYSLQVMKSAEWLLFMNNIERLFRDLKMAGSWKKTTPPPLQPALLEWKKCVSTYSTAIKRLETSLGEKGSAIKCLLSCHAEAQHLKVILYHLQQVEGKPIEIMLQKLVGKLSRDGSNAENLKDCILDFVVATTQTVETCSRIWDAKYDGLEIPGLPPPPHKSVTRKNLPVSANAINAVGDKCMSSMCSAPPAVVDVMVAGWALNDDIDERDRRAISSFAGFLGICADEFSDSKWNAKLAEATKFWQKIEDEITKEAMRLEGLQRALKAKDPKGTAILLQELGIVDSSLLDEELASLPSSIANMIEKVGFDEVEMSFRLDALTELQRAAMGIPQGATSILLRLSFNAGSSNSPAFCLHYNNEPGLDKVEHTTPWICSPDSNAPPEQLCTSPTTAFTWQLRRFIHQRLQTYSNGLAPLYKFLSSSMLSMGQICVSCGVSHNASKAQLRRATPCDFMACARLWYQLPLDVRIPEIRTDTYAVDMMLTSVYAAAMSGRPELLPSCPIPSSEAVKTILNSLPTMTVLSHAVNMSAVLRSYHKDAETLISWACVHFRGYIATATGLCKIHNMPAGTHQFVLASASPRIESDFVAKLPRPNSKTTVLFHGTSLDRLPAILAQGLRVCSGTTLQRTGAAHGKGIYMAEEPATSMSYAPAALSWRNSGLSNMRLLLGCEVVGEARSVSRGIRLVTDEKSAIVRYIFLVTSTASVPIANHIVPAMASSMVALRIGAV